MNIVFVNASPKQGKSCSKYLLETIKSNISDEKNIYEISISDKKIRNEDKFHIISNCEKIVLALPLYVDCLPASVIDFLEGLEEYSKSKNFEKNAKLYGIVNCGFFEGTQNRSALKVLKNFTKHIENLSYGGGIGIGAGAFVGGSDNIPLNSNIKLPIKESIEKLTNAINDDECFREDIFANINLKKRVYLLAGELSWLTAGIKNKIYPWMFSEKCYKDK